AAAALSSFEEPVILISGGTDKKCPFEPLVSALDKSIQDKHLKSLYLLEGTATEKLLDAVKSGKAESTAALSSVLRHEPFGSLEELLRALKAELDSYSDKARPVVVFSPGATSFGMFKNEFDRGNTFKQLVKQIFC
ncbi:MAG: UDP-N-acetylmuramoyl-L-alanine--D-glutamate ligase, partial [Spirochaetaceae bacterium]|nr:UDP-N-acetylmuramoyl-L-alanine--D-glutamate ligase [Spirochaetaceae bacterium]